MVVCSFGLYFLLLDLLSRVIDGSLIEKIKQIGAAKRKAVMKQTQRQRRLPKAVLVTALITSIGPAYAASPDHANVNINFPFEALQLADADVGNFSAIAFGNATVATAATTGTAAPACRAFPGSEDWPSVATWARLNVTMDGGLLHPSPLGAVCYPSANGTLGAFNLTQCLELVFGSFDSRVYIDDPLTVLTSWPQGDTCTATLQPQGTCTRGGFPEYVVNVTTVKQVQAAVNFARNENVRLVVK